MKSKEEIHKKWEEIWVQGKRPDLNANQHQFEMMEEYTQQFTAKEVPVQGQKYSKGLREKLLSWLMGNRLIDPSSANIIIDHFERYAFSPLVDAEPEEKSDWVKSVQKDIDDLAKIEGGLVEVKNITIGKLNLTSLRFGNGNCYWIQLSKQSKVSLG